MIRTSVLAIIFVLAVSWEIFLIPNLLRSRGDLETRAPTTDAPIGPTAPAPTKAKDPTKVRKKGAKAPRKTKKKPTKAPTTDAPTDAPTNAPTTDAPTDTPTKAPTTDAPTKAPTTDAPTDAPTKAPTTDAPTEAPTKAPTTDAPTTKAPTTDVPTNAPTTKAPITGTPADLTGGGTTAARSSSSSTLGNNNCKEDLSKKELLVLAHANMDDTCRRIGGDNKDGSSSCWIQADGGNSSNIEVKEAACMDHSLDDTAMKFIPSPGYPNEKLALIRGQGTVLMNNGHVLTPGGLVITRSAGCCMELDNLLPKVNHPLPQDKTDQIADPSIVQNGLYEISHHHMLRYYHFMAQSLPRLEYFMDELVKDGGVYSNLRIRVTQEAMKYDFVHEAIALMGISTDRLYATNEKKQNTPWWIPDNKQESNQDDPTSGLVVVPPGVPTHSSGKDLYIQSEGGRMRSMARRMRQSACNVKETKDRFDRAYWERACGANEEGWSDDQINVLVINRGDHKENSKVNGGDHQRNIVNHEELMSSLQLQFEKYINSGGGGGWGSSSGNLRSDSDNNMSSTSGGRRQLQEQNGSGKETTTVLEFKEHLKGTTTFSMADDIVMFGGADILVAPHGAGTTNVIFMAQPGGLVIELYCEGQGARVFDFLARRFGQQFCGISNGMSWVGSKELLEERRARNSRQMNLPMEADLDVVMPQIMECVRKWWEGKQKKKL